MGGENGETVPKEDDTGNQGIAGQRVLAVELQDRNTKKSLVVITGHFKSGTNKDDVPMKKKHIDAVLEWISTNKKFKGKPLIFGMDFNTDVTTEAFAYWEERKTHYLKKLDLQSAYRLEDTER